MRFISSIIVTSLLFMTSAHSNSTEWHTVNNHSKIGAYLNEKSCVPARNILISKGWLPFPALNGKAFNREPPMFEDVENMFIKYPELELCYPTGTGDCYAGYKQGKFLLTVEYGSAEGGAGFEDEYCNANSYKITIRD